MDKEKLSKKSFKYVILSIIIVVFIIIFCIYKYNTYNTSCLIYYVENESPSGTMSWNMAITTRVKVLNNGTLIYDYNGKEGKLDEETLKEVKILVKQLKQEVKGVEENHNATNRFTINNKTYSVESLNSEGKKIISQIRDILY